MNDKMPSTNVWSSKAQTLSLLSIEKENLLADFENYLRAEGQRMNTIQSNKIPVRLFLRWLESQQVNYLEVSYNDLLEFVKHSKNQGNVVRTVNAKLLAIRHFYNYLQSEKQVTENPCKELQIKGEVKRLVHDVLEWEELETLYKNYPTQNLTGKRNKVMLGMMIYQGLTSGEIAALEPKDINLENAKIYIPSISRSNSRTLNLESTQILQIQNYLTQIRPVLLILTGKKSEKLFVSAGDGMELKNTHFNLLKKAKKMNPKIKTPKQIRSSVIVHWLKTHNIRQVQYMSGHRYVSSTERYKTNHLDSLQEMIDELHPLK